MNDGEKHVLVLAHVLARQENEIQYLKALLLEKTDVKFEEFQREQDEFWEKTKNFRIHEVLTNLQALEADIDKVPDDMDLDKYMDHLRWPTDPSDGAT